MRGLTVRQPWAWAILHGGKDVENRIRNIAGAYRGPVAIQAGLAWDESAMATLQRLVADWHEPTGPNEDPWAHRPDGIRGAILGVVDLTDVHTAEDCWPGSSDADLAILPVDRWLCSPWAQPDSYHLVLTNPRPLTEPIPWRGRQGLWNLPDEVLAGQEYWDASIPPGGWQCVVCGMPTESEPCPTHGGAA